MRQGWTQLLRQGGHIHSAEKPHWNQEQVSVRMALVITGMQVVPREGPWHPVHHGVSHPWGQLHTVQMTLL